MATTSAGRIGSQGEASITATVTAAALVLAAVLVILGNFFEEYSDTQNLVWGLGALGLSIGGLLLALRMVAVGRHLEAAGFTLLAIANVALFAGPRASEAADYVLYQLALVMGSGLLLVAVGGWGPSWARIAAALSGIGFAIMGVVTTAGADSADFEWAIAIGYVPLVVALVGWALDIYKGEESRA